MKLSIIGGSGFIGSALCRKISEESFYSFNIIDKNQSFSFPNKTKIADVRNVNDLERSIDDSVHIINLAAEHRDDVFPINLYHDVNVMGAVNICDAARKKNVSTIIFTSSVAVYGFAPIGTSELGAISPFNEYGRTKYQAELVYKAWQAESPANRTLVIVRPTVVFGERNRGNVFNLLKQIVSRRFVMVGKGHNRKSIAYVENVAAFLEYALTFKPGLHIYNYVDKPDFTMNRLVTHVNQLLGRTAKIKIRIPYLLGLMIGNGFDLVAKIIGRKFTISAIRVKKFCADSVYESKITKTGFVAPIPIMEALQLTIKHEFVEEHSSEPLFYSE
jgi:nucleoside-diphosphate-sugar epimerase